MPNRSFLSHVVSLYESFDNLPLDINIDGRTFTVRLKGKGCEFFLYPKFLVSNPNYTYYISQVHSEVVAFSGWQNYRRPPYPEARQGVLSNKLLTKKELQGFGIKVPQWSNNPSNAISPVLVKSRVSSFALDIHGPFQRANDYPNINGQAEFYEEFIEGEIIKIWFWRKTPVILESQPMPTIVGNGVETIDELIRIRAGYHKDFLFEDRLDEVLSYHGKRHDDVLQKDEELLVDFRYGSLLADAIEIDEFYFPLTGHSKVQEQIDQLSFALGQILDINSELDFVYTVDAILTATQELYILEINTNPEIHPYLYRFMAESIAKQLPDNVVL